MRERDDRRPPTIAQAMRAVVDREYRPCAHVPVRSGGCRGGRRWWHRDPPLRLHVVPGLRKPSWTPPSQVFAPVWTVLYAQMAYSANRVARSSDPGRRRALALWWLQLGLNAAWTPVFFGARRTGAAAVVVGALVPAVAATAATSARVDRPAGLLAPYLACLVDLCGRAQPRDLAAEPLLDDRLAIGLCRPQCVDADAGGVGRAVRLDPARDLVLALEKLRSLVARAVRGLRRPSVRMSSARWRSRPGRAAGARPRRSSGNPEAGNPIIGAFGW